MRSAAVVLLCLGACVAALPGNLTFARAETTTWDGVYAEAQAAAGEALYQERCAVCHLPDLDGGEDAPPLAGAVFSGVWNGRPLQVLAGRIQARMPQDAPGTLSPDEATALVAFILRRNGFPAGPGRLSADAAALGAIRYTSERAR